MTNDPTQPDEATARLLATAYHEAGHAVMATRLGRPIQNVTISPAKMQTGGTRLGACKIQKGRTKPSKDWLEDEVLILYAGMVAESHFTGQYCEAGAKSDLQAIRHLLSDRAKNERQLEKLERRMLDKAEYLLAEPANEKAIEYIVKELIEKETVSGRAVKHFLLQATQQFGGS